VTQPRQVIADRTYFLSRRCTQRQFLLRPDESVEQIYLYCLAEAAQRFDITIHGWIAMSNHHHALIHDTYGRLPAFLAHLHKMLAKALNALRGRWENFWASEQPNAVYLVDKDDRFDKLLYILANPVADHLVDRVTDWPGASSLSMNLSGREKRVKRPRGFFREDGPMPEEVVLRAHRPHGFEDLSDAAWRKKLTEALAELEAKARSARRRDGSGVVGRRAVLGVDPEDRPATVAPRRTLRPCVGCLDRVKRKVELALLRGFRVAYRIAFCRWRAGARDVLFPPGTYAMLAFGAVVAS
jgi:putative transposase